MKKGSLLAYTRKYHSPLPKQEAVARVQNALQQNESVRIHRMTASDRELRFAQKQDPAFRNSFLPDIHVLFSDLEAGSQARIECRVKLFIRIFCIVYFLGCAQSLIFALMLLFTGRDGAVLYALISLAMLLFCYGLSYFGLHYGAKKAVSVIRKALLSE